MERESADVEAGFPLFFLRKKKSDLIYLKLFPSPHEVGKKQINLILLAFVAVLFGV